MASAQGNPLDSKNASDPLVSFVQIVDGRKRRSKIAYYLLYCCYSILAATCILAVVGFFDSSSEIPEYTRISQGTFDWDKVVPNSKLIWEECDMKKQCAKLQVPLDHENPSGEEATIALLRVKAKVPQESKKYRGPILINPGGPGGSGVQFVNALGEEIQDLIGDEYDIVGFDPRGIGLSTPKVSIFPDVLERVAWVASTPPLINSTSDSFSRLYARSDLAGELAVTRTKHSAEYVSTAAVARDMLAITRAHGRDKLLYWGFSYGTVLGATYAAMFPDNIERLIIDGVVEFSDYYSGRWYSNLHDTDSILQWFFDECVSAGTACPLYANSSALVQQRVDNIFAAIKSSPLPVIEGPNYGIIDYGLLKQGLFISLYQPFALLNLYASILAALEKGDTGSAMAFWASRVERPRCDSPPSQAVLREAGIAVFCGEGQEAGRGAEDISQHMNELRKLSVFADVWTDTTRMNCAGWKIKVKERFTGPFNTSTSFPLLVIGNTADPVTPLRGAKQAAESFKNATLLTVNTPGHCSMAGTSPSAMKYIRNYFRDGTLPPKGTVCEIEDKLFGGKRDAFNVVTAEDQLVYDATRALHHKFGASRDGYFL